MHTDTYSIDNKGGVIRGCIDLVHSPDDGGWYAQEYDFKSENNATRTSSKIYPSKFDLTAALAAKTHRWKKWD